MSLEVSPTAKARRRLLPGIGVSAVALLVAVGVFAANDWFPKTDPMTGAKTGWFGRSVGSPHVSKGSRHLSGPQPNAMPSGTPQHSKDYIYAGSRLLAVEDANATAAPPADLAVWRPTGGEWYVMGQTGSQFTYAQWGISTDIPVPGDYDGDGKTDFAVWRPSDGGWWIFYSSTSTYAAFNYGQNGDIPVVADYDGDGKSDTAIARPNSNSGKMEWYVPYSGGGGADFEWGFHDDIPGPADFDGDGKADPGVYRASSQEYYWIRSSDGQPTGVDLNNTGDKIVSSDYDGDGKADPAVFNSSTAYWHIYQSTTNSVVSHLWGTAGASGCTGSNCSGIVPVQNDYDLDGKTDLSVWSAGWWIIKRSSNNTTRTEQWGTTGDIPVPAFYRR